MSHSRPFQCMAVVLHPQVHMVLLALSVQINPMGHRTADQPFDGDSSPDAQQLPDCLSVILPHYLRRMQAVEPQRSVWWVQVRIVFLFCAVKQHATALHSA